MKKLILLFACSLTLFATAQNTVNITSAQYESLKQSHQLDLTKRYVFSDAGVASAPVHYHKINGGEKSQSSICSCLIPLDSSFTVAPIIQGAANPPDYRNDDGSTPSIIIPFGFNLYGTSHHSLYINNNGNISFSLPYTAFTADSFPSNQFEMVAPFWSDVDTRNPLSGLVYYKITPTALIVKWDHVGYYNQHTDRLNTFQLIITDGTDPLLPAGDNVGFCYGDMQWTTGDASQGINGSGGYAATVGVNKGDSVNFFQVGRFDHDGTVFDGPYGNNDSVSWLDNQGMYFNLASSTNIPPVIINNTICDTIDVYTGDTTHSMLIDSVRFSIGVSTPERGQTVNVLVSSPDASHLAYTMIQNNPTYKEYLCSFSVLNLATGLHYINVVATDDGTPYATSYKTYVIRSHFDISLVGIKENNITSSISIYPNPADANITVKHNISASSNPVLTITDVIGQTVLTSQLNNQEQVIDISKLSKGVYFATINNKEGKSVTIKVVRK